jgi:hypothetical protein
MKYFVSYTTRDKEVTKELLAVFSKQLEKSGKVFIDIIDNDSIDKQARVMEELENSDLMILVESKSIYQSEWVTLEVEKAKSKQIPIKKISIYDLSNFKI